jgi:hypothetical protein
MIFSDDDNRCNKKEYNLGAKQFNNAVVNQVSMVSLDIMPGEEKKRNRKNVIYEI